MLLLLLYYTNAIVVKIMIKNIQNDKNSTNKINSYTYIYIYNGEKKER